MRDRRLPSQPPNLLGIVGVISCTRILPTVLKSTKKHDKSHQVTQNSHTGNAEIGIGAASITDRLLPHHPGHLASNVRLVTAPTPGMERSKSSFVRHASEDRRRCVRSTSISEIRLSSQAMWVFRLFCKGLDPAEPRRRVSLEPGSQATDACASPDHLARAYPHP